MTESEQAMLDSLIARAENAKRISDRIAVLSAYDHDTQAKHVEIRLYAFVSREMKLPDEYEVRHLLELGRQTMLTQLQEELKTVLGVVKPLMNNLREYQTFVPAAPTIQKEFS